MLQQEPLSVELSAEPASPESLISLLIDDRPVKQQPLTFIAKIKPGSKTALESLLKRKINVGDINNEDNEIRSLLKQSSLTHFARFVILGDEAADSQPYFHLYFSSNYDGEFADYIQELSEIMGEKLNAIFQHCEGYTSEMALNGDRLSRYIKDHSVRYTNVFYNAHRKSIFQPGRSAQSIQATYHLYEKLRENLERIDNDALRSSLSEFYNYLAPLVQSFIAALTDKPVSGQKPSGNPLRHIARHCLGLKLDETPNPARLAEIYTGLEREEYQRFKLRLKDLNALEDKVTQNQITVLTPVKTSAPPFLNIQLSWYYRTFLTLFLLGLHVRAPNDLPNLGTIHFARWVIVDLETKLPEGRSRKMPYLLFESNYDGAWDSYIDTFVKKTGDGMNLIWGNCVGFPETGVEDIQWFKYYIRKHQLPAQVFYSAYRHMAVERIKRDRQLSQQAMRLVEFLHQKEVQQFLTNL